MDEDFVTRSNGLKEPARKLAIQERIDDTQHQIIDDSEVLAKIV